MPNNTDAVEATMLDAPDASLSPSSLPKVSKRTGKVFKAPRPKKGKKFASKDIMSALIEQINSVEDGKVEVKIQKNVSMIFFHFFKKIFFNHFITLF